MSRYVPKSFVTRSCQAAARRNVDPGFEVVGPVAGGRVPELSRRESAGRAAEALRAGLLVVRRLRARPETGVPAHLALVAEDLAGA